MNVKLEHCFSIMKDSQASNVDCCPGYQCAVCISMGFCYLFVFSVFVFCACVFFLFSSHHTKFLLWKRALKSSKTPPWYLKNTSHHTALSHLLLTCSFEAQMPPLCSGRCSHCGPRLQTLFPLQWRPQLPHVAWSAQTRTPSGAFVGQSALQSSGVNCHQNHL